MLISHTRFLSIDISFGYSIKNTDNKNMINSNKYLIGKLVDALSSLRT